MYFQSLYFDSKVRTEQGKDTLGLFFEPFHCSTKMTFTFSHRYQPAWPATLGCLRLEHWLKTKYNVVISLINIRWQYCFPRTLSQRQKEKGELPVSTVSPKMAEVCGQVLLGSGLTVLSHPLMYIKVLIQVRGGEFGQILLRFLSGPDSDTLYLSL